MTEGVLQHASQQTEADALRQVTCEIPLLGLGKAAQWLQATPVGGLVKVAGFLNAKSRNSRSLVLHVNTIEFLEGTENGSILQEEGR